VRQGQAEVLRVKAAVRERDGMRCTHCGMTNRKHKARYAGKSLHVHRTMPGSDYSLAGCVTLCFRCHGPMPKLPPGSRGKTNKMVRLHDDVYQAMKGLVRGKGRALTREVWRALEAHLKAQGWPPTPQPDEK
jgi:hypothetical protein